MSPTMTEDQKRENRIAALFIASSNAAKALLAVKKQIQHNQAHPSIMLLRARKVELGQVLLFLDKEFDDVIDGKGSIPAPDDNRIKEIAALSREVDQMIRNAHTANALIDAANSAIKLANDVKNATS